MKSAATARQLVSIGLGEWVVSVRPARLLACYGLGSCVAVTAFDPQVGCAGMAHIVLPDSSLGRADGSSAKFADAGVPRLVEAMLAKGARADRLVVKIAGGARMLLPLQSALDIGGRNVAAVEAALARLGLSIQAADTGGTHGRTVMFDGGTGRVTVTSVVMGARVEREL